MDSKDWEVITAILGGALLFILGILIGTDVERAYLEKHTQYICGKATP